MSVLNRERWTTIRRASRRFARALRVLLVLACGSTVSAADLQVEFSARETQVGVPITMQVTISDAEPGTPPTIPPIPGVKVRSRGGPSRSSQMVIINGAMQSRTSLTYEYELTPSQQGQFTVGPIEMCIGTETHKSTPVTIMVARSETGDLLFVDIKCDRKKLYVGESLQMKLQIWLRPYTDASNGKLNEASMWNCLDRATDLGSFGEVLQQMMARGRLPTGRENLRKDSRGQERGYYLYELERTVQVNRPGLLAAEDVNVVVTYPTRLGRSNDLFSMGRLSIISAMRISAQATIEPIEVLPVPTKGRPAYYAGAVGHYQIQASAKPTEVAVGDPITLTLTIKGPGDLADLQPPPLASMAVLTGGFRVPSEPLAGEVTPDGKRFSVSIRAMSDTVTEIPSIPFVYFDPQTERFVTARSRPVSLKVKPADRLAMSQIVDASGGRAPTANRLTESAGGILANYTGMDEVLTQQAFQPGPLAAATLLVPPILFLGSWSLRRRSERFRTDVGFARGRRARKHAMERLRGVGDLEVSAAAAAITTAMGHYVADRCNLPSGGMTRAAVVEQLPARQVEAALVAEVDDLLAECEAVHYGGSSARSARELHDRAVRCVERLEAEKMRPTAVRPAQVNT